MERLKLTKEQKRLLIVWICALFFIFFINLAKIEGKMLERDGTQYSNILTTSDGNSLESFWPFVSDKIFTSKDSEAYKNGATPLFKGFFYAFDWSEFLVYSVLGVAILFIRKIW